MVLVWFRWGAHGHEIRSVDDENLKIHKTLRRHHAQGGSSVSDGRSMLMVFPGRSCQPRSHEGGSVAVKFDQHTRRHELWNAPVSNIMNSGLSTPVLPAVGCDETSSR